MQTIHETKEDWHERRYAQVRISSVLFAELFVTGARVRVASGVGALSDLVGVYYDYDDDSYVLRFVSPQFRALLEGEQVPYISVAYEIDDAVHDSRAE